MPVLKTETMLLQVESDVVKVRHRARALAAELRFSVVDQTKLVTATSELARNAVVHGKGGTAVVEVVDQDGRLGVRLVFEDHGPGIADLAQAMTDGYTSGGGMGLGLGGAKRLVNEFEILSEPGRGTRVTIIRWKQ